MGGVGGRLYAELRLVTDWVKLGNGWAANCLKLQGVEGGKLGGQTKRKRNAAT